MSRLDALGLSVKFGNSLILDDVSLSIPRGKLIGLLGPNGAGKTTLIRALAGLQKVEQGQVKLDGEKLSAFDQQDLGRRIAYLAQGAECSWPLKVERIVMLGRTPYLYQNERLREDDYSVTERVMREADVSHLVGRTVNTLSGGELTRVMLARALASEPEFLLADEPVASLDPLHQLEVMGLLANVAHGGGAVVVVLHDLNLAMRFCDRVVLLSEGRVAADGEPGEVFTAEILEQVYGIDVKFGECEGKPWLLPWQRAGQNSE
ncbi:MAG: hypothetical protein DRQ61_03190 [Gammaproteobacteria bacterium]|nr:MAG: hypothetical protein DRQ56_01975 [Gammaproteobacteria bacterium]RLA23667.1 MAG: hypothetical protein DRQ61_03190 [Gammaproteobacteria bacterium]